MIWGDQNPSTGYSWILDYSDCEEELHLVSDTYESSTIGAPGHRYLTFKVRDGATGSCNIPFKYERPWMLDEDWAETQRTKVALTFT